MTRRPCCCRLFTELLIVIPMAHCTHPRAELFANTSLAEDEKTYRIVFEDNVFPLESSALLIHWYSVCVNLRNISSFSTGN